MFSNVLAVGLLVPFAVQAVRTFHNVNLYNRQDSHADLGLCLNDCLKSASAFRTCANDTRPGPNQIQGDSCVCKIDSDGIIQDLRCEFDCLAPMNISFSFNTINSAHLGEKIDNFTTCGGSATPPTRGTRATQFNLPTCANTCLASDIIPECTSEFDPTCVCSAIDDDSKPSQTTFVMTQCVLNSCDKQDAASALIQLGIDCGSWGPNTNTSQMMYPMNKLKSAFDAKLVNSNGEDSSRAQAKNNGTPQSRETHTTFILTLSGVLLALISEFVRW